MNFITLFGWSSGIAFLAGAAGALFANYLFSSNKKVEHVQGAVCHACWQHSFLSNQSSATWHTIHMRTPIWSSHIPTIINVRLQVAVPVYSPAVKTDNLVFTAGQSTSCRDNNHTCKLGVVFALWDITKLVYSFIQVCIHLIPHKPYQLAKSRTYPCTGDYSCAIGRKARGWRWYHQRSEASPDKSRTGLNWLCHSYWMDRFAAPQSTLTTRRDGVVSYLCE